MTVEIVMPRLSDTMDAGKVAHWNKNVGDEVHRGEVLLEIETDKANMELESYADGILANIAVGEGESAPVGSPIGVVAENETELELLRSGPGPSVKEAADHDASAAAAGEIGQPHGPEPEHPAGARPKAPATRVKASPLARRMAAEHDLDLSAVPGTGPNGRIIREDIEAYLRQRRTEAPRAEESVTRGPAERAEIPVAAEDESVPMSRMQQAVARRLSESKFSAPHFYVTVEIDMTTASAFIQQVRAADPSARVGPNDILVKACGLALKRFPNVNASYHDGQIVHHGRVHIGNAVSLPDGLITPVIRDADTKTLGTIAAESKQLTARAREGKLQPSEYEDATFTISNLGMYGVEQFTAIINPPGSAILAVGSITPKPVVVDGAIVVRDRMRVTLSVDHRVIYGAEAAEFLAELRRLLEQPVLIFL